MPPQKCMVSFSTVALVSMLANPALADCSTLPTWQQLKTAVTNVVAAGGNGGLGFNMWATLVATDGTVCAVAFSGQSYTDQWLGSRVISAQKANTANAFSLGLGSTPGTSLFGTNGLALSTANLFTAVQPGGSLYGLQHSNPVDTEIAYGNDQTGLTNASLQQTPSNPQNFGTPNDPMVGRRAGGVNVFGGGLAVYQHGIRVGGLGVSGDTSCTDHMVAWRVRNTLSLDQLQGVPGVSGDSKRPDNIIFDITQNGFPHSAPGDDGGTGQAPIGTGGVGQSGSGFGHPKCLNNPDQTALPKVH